MIKTQATPLLPVKSIGVLLVLVLGSFITAAQQPGEKGRLGRNNLTRLFDVFQDPRDSVQTTVYWHWISGHISKEGVIKDLEAMKKVGINRAFIANIGLSEIAQGNVTFLSVEWWYVLHAALKTAAQLNIEIGIFNAPGWSQSGGPWIKPEQSMRYLAISQTLVEGGKIVDVVLPKPKSQFQDQRVVAYPEPPHFNRATPELFAQPRLDGLANLLVAGNKKAVNLDKGGHQQIDWTFPSGYTARSLIVHPAETRMFAKVVLQASVDSGYQTIKEFFIDRQNDALNTGFDPYAPLVVSFSEVTAKRFRILLNDYTVNSGITGLELLERPMVERFPEKTLAKMFPSPLPFWNEYQWPHQPSVRNAAYIINPATVLDLTSKMDPAGRLHWNAPPGKWVVMRTGMTGTLVTNSPAPVEGTGLEVDKMSKKHVAYHFDQFLGQIILRIPAKDRKTWKVVVEDSYETGSQNWTDDFIADFKAAYHYDPVPYLPVYKGEVVGSQDQSDRFLWDVRRLIADNVAYKYVGGLRDVSHRHGLTTWLENYGHWGFPGEFLQYGGQSDEIAGEFWSEGELGDIENRAAASSAHIYGKKKVSSESFTAAGKDYSRHPALIKQRGDRFFAEGINNTLLHVYIHQPYQDKVPGVNAWYGTEFNRYNTWFFEMDDFIRYLKRTNYLLQQGLYVADVAYFIGEDAPKMTGVQDPALPKGYSFDYINGEVILERLVVKNGRFTLPDGMSYKILVLPKLETMRPVLLAKIADLVKQGGVVFGPRPLRSPSLAGYPQADSQLNRIARDMWGNNVTGRFVRPYGKGLLINGPDLQSALRYVNVPPDVRLGSDSVVFLHRNLPGSDLYFLANQSAKRINFSPAFRKVGKVPELWNAVTGTRRELRQYSVGNGYTTVPLELDSYESCFIVFHEIKKGSPVQGGVNFPMAAKTTLLTGPWTVQFDAGKRGPIQPLLFDTLSSWTESTNDSVKYYSGSAIYTKTFGIDVWQSGQRMFLDLGALTSIAKVRVNGTSVGSVWTAPYQLDITKAVQLGQNTLEIKVTNNWINRLIGDSAVPAENRKTWNSFSPFKPGAPLQQSGLLGPVRLHLFDQ